MSTTTEIAALKQTSVAQGAKLDAILAMLAGFTPAQPAPAPAKPVVFAPAPQSTDLNAVIAAAIARGQQFSTESVQSREVTAPQSGSPCFLMTGPGCERNGSHIAWNARLMSYARFDPATNGWLLDRQYRYIKVNVPRKDYADPSKPGVAATDPVGTSVSTSTGRTYVRIPNREIRSKQV